MAAQNGSKEGRSQVEWDNGKVVEYFESLTKNL